MAIPKSKAGKASSAHPEPRKLLFLLLGPAGSGKSTFINLLAGSKVAPVNKSLSTDVAVVGSYAVKHPTLDHDLIFIDTPGIGDYATSSNIREGVRNFLKRHVPTIQTTALQASVLTSAWSSPPSHIPERTEFGAILWFDQVGSHKPKGVNPFLKSCLENADFKDRVAVLANSDGASRERIDNHVEVLLQQMRGVIGSRWSPMASYYTEDGDSAWEVLNMTMGRLPAGSVGLGELNGFTKLAVTSNCTQPEPKPVQKKGFFKRLFSSSH